MRVLVTGGTGLVGVFAIDKLLRSGKSVTALVRSSRKLQSCLKPFGHDSLSDPSAAVLSTGNLRVVEGDITDRSAVTSALEGCDAVIHAAGVFSNKRADRQRLQETNVSGSRNVLELACQAGCDPVVHVSSYLALFPGKGDKLTASDPVSGLKGQYARSKVEAEIIARDLQATGQAVVCVYPASIQGPNDPTYGPGSEFIEHAIRSKRWLSSGNPRSYVDVRYLADLFEAVLEPGRGPRGFVAGGHYLSDQTVIEILRKLTGRDIQAQKFPAALMRLIGSSLDFITSLSGKEFPLTREGADVLTISKPTDERSAEQALGIKHISAEQSFYDLIQWMLDSGKLDPNRINLVPPSQSASR